MNLAQGIRHKKRIDAASTLGFLVVSFIGLTIYLNSPSVATWNVMAAEFTTANGQIGHLIASGLVVLPVAFMISWVAYSILNFVYMKEPGYSLKEGCYSDVSWLNLIDNQLVILDKDAIYTAAFNDEQAETISETYQNDSSCQDLRYVLNSEQLCRIQFSDIKTLNSRTDKDFIELVSSRESIYLQFKNTGTKAHALKYINARLTTTVDVKEFKTAKTSSLEKALPHLAVCALFVLGAVLANQVAISLVLAAPAVFLLPSIIEFFYAPAVQTVLNAAPIKAVPKFDDEPAIRQAA